MKRLTNLLALGMFLLMASAFAAVPQLISFQGILKDGSGNLVANGPYSVIFTIYDAAAGGSVQWAETTSVTTSSGLFSVLLGSTNPVPDTAFDNPNRWLGVKVGADPEMIPRQQLVSVGYGYRVSSVDGALGGSILTKVSIGPGHTNTGINAFVAGENNTTSGIWSTVGGGENNDATGLLSTISGGQNHTANNVFATIGGGVGCLASGGYATVGGGAGNGATNDYATASGGLNNNVSGNAATIGGGQSNIASGTHAAVGGGEANTASNSHATVGGGTGNTASEIWATVGGGASNTANGVATTIGGGRGNTATVGGYDATIGGGRQNSTSGVAATIGGGVSNSASNSATTIGGGESNTASDAYTTVGGGYTNSANNGFATVGGGYINTASGISATVGGGLRNRASGRGATVGGGQEDTASGDYSTVPGGHVNTAAGAYSLAAGRRAKANHLGTFVWADSSVDADFASTAANQFLIRAAGGVGIGTTSPAALLHVNGSAGNNTGVWSNLSDRRLKTEIWPIQGALKTVEALQGVSFRWKDAKKDAEYGRVRGLIAQDVEKILPEWVKTDPDGHKRLEPIGVDALLIEAIKELRVENEELSAEMKELKKLVQKLLARNEGANQTYTLNNGSK